MSRFSFSCFGSRVLSWLMACLLAFATSNTPASAQMACPQGVTPGSSQCLPTGGAQQSQPPVPKPRWRLTWGAIAMSSRTGEVGTSVGRFSKREATREAMEKCSILAGKNAKLLSPTGISAQLLLGHLKGARLLVARHLCRERQQSPRHPI